MKRPWTAEIDLSPEAAVALVEHQFPALAPVQMEPFGMGWDNCAYLVNGQWVFRFPRRHIAVPLLATESRVLPAIADQLPLPVPSPSFLGQPTDVYPYPFAGYSLLPGRTACRAKLGEAERHAAALPLANFLRTLHELAPKPDLDVPPDELRRLEMDHRIPMVRQRLERALELHLVKKPAPLRQVIARTPKNWRPGTSTLVHGDLYARHLLVDKDNHLAGVIDWGDLHLGDPAIDLAIAYAFLPDAARATFLDAYGPVDNQRLAVARLRALFSCLTILLYGHDIGDEDLASEGRRGLAYIASSLSREGA